jgi:bis(5'-nucleosidyl)-tetraphosphatase
MKREFSAGVIVYHKDAGVRKYLLLQYARGAHNFWDLPKGHIEGAETKEQTALRELQEEAGLVVKLDPGFEESLSYHFTDYKTKDTIHKTVYFFTGYSPEVEVTLSHEHVGYSWLPFDEALATLTYDSARQLMTKADEFLNGHNVKIS